MVGKFHDLPLCTHPTTSIRAQWWASAFPVTTDEPCMSQAKASPSPCAVDQLCLTYPRASLHKFNTLSSIIKFCSLLDYSLHHAIMVFLPNQTTATMQTHTHTKPLSLKPTFLLQLPLFLCSPSQQTPRWYPVPLLSFSYTQFHWPPCPNDWWAPASQVQGSILT